MTAHIDVVAIASHPDDAEIGVGGILALATAQGKRTAIIDLSDGEPTPFGSPTIRATESAAASQALSLTTRINLGLKNREITDSVEHRVRLAETLRELRPEIVLVHHSRDNHPDHVAAHHLSIAACFYGKLVKSSIKNAPWSPKRIYEYGGFHLRNREHPSLIVDISPSFETKMASIRCYHSQFIAHKDNQAVLSDIEADARYWGAQIRTGYGEALFAREMVGIKDINVLCNL